MIFLILFSKVFPYLEDSLETKAKTIEMKPILADKKPIVVFNDPKGINKGLLTLKNNIKKTIDELRIITANEKDNYIITEKQENINKSYRKNQQFTLDVLKNSTYMLRIYSYKCLSFSADSNIFVLKDCRKSDSSQIFILTSGLVDGKSNSYQKLFGARSKPKNMQLHELNGNFFGGNTFINHGPTYLSTEFSSYPGKKKVRRFENHFNEINDGNFLDEKYYESLKYLY